MNLLNKIIKMVLVAILIIAILQVIYLVVFHNPGQDYTEFYIVDYNNDTLDYPTNVTQNSVEKIFIGIKNQEHQKMNYTIQIVKDNETITKFNQTLEDKETIELPYYVHNTKNKGINQTLNFILFKGNVSEPYRSLYLRYNVI
ncbi:MAG: hypothetical protein BZ138_02855 [Methanosphaera sp. rholeuAM270]|nr:MAG: hypothetical protein BZ138_02855 [Methanosphaera sp. rholeuAM270]